MKFRVWDKQKCKYVDTEKDFYIDSDGDLFTYDQAGYYGKTLNRCDQNRFIVRWFTGHLPY